MAINIIMDEFGDSPDKGLIISVNEDSINSFEQIFLLQELMSVIVSTKKDLVLDLSQVKMIGSACIKVMLVTSKKMKELGKDVKFKLSDSSKEVARVLNVDQILNIL